jgi:hypothetical protein
MEKKYFIFFLLVFTAVNSCGGEEKDKFLEIVSQKWIGVNNIKVPRIHEKKRSIFYRTINNFNRKISKYEKTMTASVWLRPKALGSKLSEQKFLDFPTEVKSKKKFFDYTNKGGYESFFVDFANKKLGGGWKSKGWVQEEIMFAEIPQLASYQLDGSFGLTRSGSSDPLKGNPKPIVFQNAKRTIEFETQNSGLYGYKLFAPSVREKDIKSSIIDIKPQTVNILAMSAPKINKKAAKTKEVFKDLLTTSCLGFKLVKEVASNKKVFIGTGKFGAGAFNNDPIVTNVAQQLAAFHVGVNSILFYGYTQCEQQQADEIVASIRKEIRPNTKVSDLIGIASKYI